MFRIFRVQIISTIVQKYLLKSEKPLIYNETNVDESSSRDMAIKRNELHGKERRENRIERCVEGIGNI